MDYIVNSLAAYEVHVARYYYRRGAYVAAANRAQQAVHEFQQTPSTEEALYIMVASYDKLGLEQLRDDADRVLQAELPRQPLSDRRPAPNAQAVVAVLVTVARAPQCGVDALVLRREPAQPRQRFVLARHRRHRRQRLAQAPAVAHLRAAAGRRRPAGRGRFRCGSSGRRPASATPPPRRRSSR